MASEVSPSPVTPASYITHHLGHLNTSAKPQASIVDFSILNIDTLLFSTVLGLIACAVLWYIARSARSGVPTRSQAAIELLFEFVDRSCKDIVHDERTRRVVAPLGLTVLVWVFLMNAMDLLPVDILPWLHQHISGDHHAYLRVVPTADLNLPLALSVGVLLLCLYYGLARKGVLGWLKEMASAPFGPWLFIANIPLNILEYLSRTISQAMRLFGNMYAGEMVFFLIALLGGTWVSLGSGDFSVIFHPLMFLLHVLTGSLWAIFHILIITLQAFIFMVLTFIYVGQAHDSH